MKFEIVRALDGKGMMETDYESCIPSDDTIRSMIKAGYKAYKDGRVYRPKDGGKMVQLGQTVKKVVSFAPERNINQFNSEKKTLYGKVIFVHPKRRFYTVEFSLWNGSKIRSCYTEGL